MAPPSESERTDADRWAAQLRKGSLELAILASLWKAPRYGLELLGSLEETGLSLTEGTLYPILNRLRGDGLLSSEWRQEGTGNPRKYYTLTPLGKSRTKAMAQAWSEFTASMDHILHAIPRYGAKS